MKNVAEVEIPKRMWHLKRDSRGFPIFFSLVRDEKGNSDFKGIDGRRVEACGQRRLCGICGESLMAGKYWLPTAFIGGLWSVKVTRAFNDPAMHVECANYAREVCPWMVMTNYRRSVDDEKYQLHPAGVDLRPKVMGMMISHGFKFLPSEHLFIAQNPRQVILWMPGSDEKPTEEIQEAYLKEVEAEAHKKLEKMAAEGKISQEDLEAYKAYGK